MMPTGRLPGVNVPVSRVVLGTMSYRTYEDAAPVFDAFFAAGQVAEERSCPASLAAFQVLMAVDNKARRTNEARLRDLAVNQADEVTVFCAHDKAQYDALAGGS